MGKGKSKNVQFGEGFKFINAYFLHDGGSMEERIQSRKMTLACNVSISEKFFLQTQSDYKVFCRFSSLCTFKISVTAL